MKKSGRVEEHIGVDEGSGSHRSVAAGERHDLVGGRGDVASASEPLSQPVTPGGPVACLADQDGVAGALEVDLAPSDSYQ